MVVIGRKTQQAPEELDAGAELAAVEQEVVAMVQSIGMLRTKVEAAQERYRRELKHPTPPDCSPVLWNATDKMLAYWYAARPELVGGKPLPSRREMLIGSARLDLEDAETRVGEIQREIAKAATGSRMQKEYLRQLQDWSQERQRRIGRLADALVNEGATKAEMREALDLQELAMNARKTTVTI
jgi:hypothetical protein